MPHEGQWGIYALNLSSLDVELLYSDDEEISGINLSSSGDFIAFSKGMQNGNIIDTTSEIFVLNVNSGNADRLTGNYYFDSYPSFSPDDSSIVFLSKRDGTLDLYVMRSDGSGQSMLYNSGGNDADVDWGSNGRIAFTRDYQIWTVVSDGTDPRQVTNPVDAGQWGNANLPIGDYDPRFSPDGSMIAFERLVDVSFANGGYDIYTISADGSAETNLTNTAAQGYARGFANWSCSGNEIIYILAAIGDTGRYDLCMMNSDGTDNRVITPEYFPEDFLCRNAIFSLDDSEIYFIGQWWE